MTEKRPGEILGRPMGALETMFGSGSLKVHTWTLNPRGPNELTPTCFERSSSFWGGEGDEPKIHQYQRLCGS
jgi:hypothetical protein